MSFSDNRKEMVSFGETSEAHSIDYVSNLKCHSTHDGQLVKAVPLTQSPEQGQLVTRLENVLKELGGCQSSEEIQKVTEENDLLNSLPGVAKSLKDAEMAMKAGGQTVKANRISKMRKLLGKIPAQKPRKQRKTLREILRLAQKNVGITLQKGGLCGSGLCGVPCITGTAIAVTGAVALIAIASAGLFDAPDLSAQVEADVGAEEVEVDNELDVDNAEGEAVDAAKQEREEAKLGWEKAKTKLQKLEDQATGNDDDSSGKALRKLANAKKKVTAAMADYILAQDNNLEFLLGFNFNGADDQILMKSILADFFLKNEDTFNSFKDQDISNVLVRGGFFAQNKDDLVDMMMESRMNDAYDTSNEWTGEGYQLEAAKYFVEKEGILGQESETQITNIARTIWEETSEKTSGKKFLSKFKMNLHQYAGVLRGLDVYERQDIATIDPKHVLDALEYVNNAFDIKNTDATSDYARDYADWAWSLALDEAISGESLGGEDLWNDEVGNEQIWSVLTRKRDIEAEHELVDDIWRENDKEGNIEKMGISRISKTNQWGVETGRRQLLQIQIKESILQNIIAFEKIDNAEELDLRGVLATLENSTADSKDTQIAELSEATAKDTYEYQEAYDAEKGIEIEEKYKKRGTHRHIFKAVRAVNQIEREQNRIEG